MTGRLVSLAVAAFASSVLAQDQWFIIPSGTSPLSDAEVAPILQSLDTERTGLFFGIRSDLWLCGGFSATLWSPESWIRHELVRLQRRVGPWETWRKVTMSDVTPEMRQRIWRARALPSLPKHQDNVNAHCAESVAKIEISGTTRAVLIQPSSQNPVRIDGFTPGFGPGFNSMFATFEDRAMRDLWGPSQDRPFVVSVTGAKGGKQDFEAKGKDLKRLR